MKKLLVLLSVALFWLAGSAMGTQVSMKFTYDDGSAVAGTIVLYQVATPADLQIGTYTLDSSGRVSANVALNPAAAYHAKLVAPNGTAMQEFWTINASSSIVNAALSILPTGEVDVVLLKSNSTVKTVQFVAFALPQIKISSCVSTPAARTGPTNDTGGGLVVGYIAAGQTFDCQMSVPSAGSYALNLRAASGSSSGGAVHFEYPAGTRVGNEVSVPFTGSNWDTYQTLSAGTITLPQGTVTVRLVVDTAGLNLNWFN